MPSKSFWPRELIYASPNPNTLSMGQQLNKAPMCPCSTCWNAPPGSPSPHTKAPNAGPANKASPAPSSSSSWGKQALSRKLKHKASIGSMASTKPLTEGIDYTTTKAYDTESISSFERY